MPFLLRTYSLSALLAALCMAQTPSQPKVDPEFQAAVQPLLDQFNGSFPRYPIGDIPDRRAETTLLGQFYTFPPDVEQKVYNYTTNDGVELPIIAFSKTNATTSSSTSVNDTVSGHKSGPAVLHIHGGGMIAGSPFDFVNYTATTVSSTGVPHFSVEYRLAPEHPFPTPLEDCYSALLWLHNHSAEFNINPSRIGVRGESAGGGLAAGLALLAKDRKLEPQLAKQILIQPMLNDSNTVDDENLIEPVTVWTYDDNITGWQAYLNSSFGTQNISIYAAPSRSSVEQSEGLPSAYIEVGEIDIFRSEDRLYAEKLKQGGVDTEFHFWKGVPHGFDAVAPNITITKEAMKARFDATTSF